ncbi:MAG: DUF4342 domain-containing protein [Myxococcota bacterium]
MAERQWVEEIEVAGRDLVDCVQKLFREGTARRVIVRDAAGTVLFELPLAAGVAVGGVVALAMPTIAALGAIAALITNCKVSVVREVPVDVESPVDPPAAADLGPDAAPIG